MVEDTYFRRKKLNKSKLLAYGFKQVSDGYRYSTTVLDGGFLFNVMIDASGKVCTEVTE